MENKYFDTPVLFIIFNRPDTTEKVFNEIKKIKPKQLFIAADGPRENKENENELCELTRNIAINYIDWNCDVKTLFREKNLGCKIAVSSAITWFFENIEEGIILEDDCLPDQSFFYFCNELLEKYRNNESVMTICGSNFQFGNKRGNASYYFSKYTYIWGWATWRRIWANYDLNIKELDEFILQKKIKKITKNKKEQKHWLDKFISVAKNGFNTWDYQYIFYTFNKNGICIYPNVNLISNIGFNDKATHTKSEISISNIPLQEIKFPLIHPKKIKIDKKADKQLRYEIYISKRQSIFKIIKNIIKKVISMLKLNK